MGAIPFETNDEKDTITGRIREIFSVREKI
jgi:hypothetical protein